jgi:hypothetical protein
MINVKLIMDEEETRPGLPSSASFDQPITIRSDNNFIASQPSVKDWFLVSGFWFLVGRTERDGCLRKSYERKFGCLQPGTRNQKPETRNYPVV